MLWKGTLRLRKGDSQSHQGKTDGKSGPESESALYLAFSVDGD